MKKIFAILAVTSVSMLFGFFSPDYLDWSSTKPISFHDFKGNAPKSKSSSTVKLSTLITFETRQVKGQVPKITIYNRLDRNASWIKVKRDDILKIQQVKFDYSELYARKIRKEIVTMNKQGIKERQKYVDVIAKYARKLDKIQSTNSLFLEDQPHLIKIMQKDIKDSLNLYKAYVK